MCMCVQHDLECIYQECEYVKCGGVCSLLLVYMRVHISKLKES